MSEHLYDESLSHSANCGACKAAMIRQRFDEIANQIEATLQPYPYAHGVRVETNTIAGTFDCRNIAHAREVLDDLVPAILINLADAATCDKAPAHASHGCFHTLRLRISDNE